MARKDSILVVDDEEIMRDVLETLLSSSGYRVDLAKTGEEGIEAYGKRAYDVVLPDVPMPGFPQSVQESMRSGVNLSSSTDLSRGVNFYDEVRRFEIELIRRALAQTNGHQSRAARLLGMNATTLNSKIKTYNIDPRG
jgi:DNA-binding NtrC family response regulator